MQEEHNIELIAIGFGTLLILFLIGFIISILFIYQRRKYRHVKELEAIKLNHDRESFKSQLEIQEETFQYISQEIHDNVGQFLSLAKLHLNTFNFDNKEIAIEKISSSSELLTTALDDLRDLSRSLSSEMIRNGGFDKAIEQQILQMQKTGKFHVIFDVKGDYHFLDEQKEIILFRILQEALNNIVRHSSASEVIIFLYYVGDSVKMLIQDNGKGFDLSFIERSRKKIVGGINNMKKRATLINADFEIESHPGSGTKIIVTSPA
jgi:signal transduction histidine kinase